MIRKLEEDRLPTAVGLIERGGEKQGKRSRAGGGGENKEERKIYNFEDSCTDLKGTWKSGILSY
jgi:hypothetical protein